ncbi:MAG TPA: RNA methyltransferase [Vicinamibacteria bacterium]|nr:RNA methyltransferase [Vicinamibacteria bacterium]
MAGVPETIRSRANPLVKRLRALASEGDPRLALIEGEKLVREALGAGLRLEEVAVTPSFDSGHALAAELRLRGIPVRVVESGVFPALSPAEASQGIVAVAGRPQFEESAVLGTAAPLLLVAVGVQNPGNLGGLLRTAEAAGATGALLTEGCADPFSWKALRGSMGSAFRLPHLRRMPVAEALDLLATRGVRVLAADGEGRLAFDQADYRGPIAILLGSEGSGLPAEARRRAALSVRIPMAGAVESLNVGVAAALLLYQAARQRGSIR